MADRILIKNAIVLTQDPGLGEMPEADILVEEQALLANYAKTITEGSVGLVIGSRRREG